MTFGFGFGFGLSRGAQVFSDEALTLFAAMTTPPTDQRKTLIDNAIQAMKAAGVWATTDVLQVYAAADSQAAKLNWKNPATFTATLVDAPTFTADRGFTTDGVNDAIDTTFNPTIGTPNYTQNSAMGGIWIVNNAQNASAGFGWFDGTDGLTVNPRDTSDRIAYRVNQASSVLQSGITDSRGFTLANRTASGAHQIDKNGSQLSSGSTASAALNNHTFLCGQSSSAGFAAAQYGLAIIGAGANVPTRTALYNALLPYMQGVGAA